MAHGPQAGDGVRRFTFDGTNGLYRDHRGLTVIADLEGSGRFELRPRNAPVELWIDEVRSSCAEGRFAQSLYVATAGNCPCVVDAFIGDPPSWDGFSPARNRGMVLGKGWVLESDGGFIVDEAHEVQTGPFPAPFLRQVEFAGEGLAVVTGPSASLASVFRAEEAGDRFSVKNAGAVRELSSTFADGTPRTAGAVSHLNAATFRVSGLGGGSLVLCRTYDRFHGRQRARVWVDQRFVGWWYDPVQDRNRRWATTMFGVPARMLDGKAEVTVTIDPPAGSALWSLSTLSVYECR